MPPVHCLLPRPNDESWMLTIRCRATLGHDRAVKVDNVGVPKVATAGSRHSPPAVATVGACPTYPCTDESVYPIADLGQYFMTGRTLKQFWRGFACYNERLLSQPMEEDGELSGQLQSDCFHCRLASCWVGSHPH